MKIVVIGGTGLIGSKTVALLRQHGHEAIAAAPSSGVDTITGKGLDAAMEGTDVVVDLANAPNWEPAAVLDFFETSGRNLFAAEKKAGVKHHVALSVVGVELLQDTSPYMRGKIAQERLIRASGVPYTIIHSTQFFEFLARAADDGDNGREIRLSTGLVQPIASDDVANAVADCAMGDPLDGVVEIAGPEKFALADIVRRYLGLLGDPRKVVADPKAKYFGAELQPETLVPRTAARLGHLRFQAWFDQSQAARRANAA